MASPRSRGRGEETRCTRGPWPRGSPATATRGKKTSTLFEKCEFHLDTLRLGRHSGLQQEEEEDKERDNQDLGKTAEYVPPWRRLLQ